MIIKNIWNKVSIYCGYHEGPVELVPNTRVCDARFAGTAVGNMLFYSCPKYYSENRSPGETACANRIKIDDYQGMVEHISEKIAENDANGVIEDLTGYEWKKRGIHFRIIKYTDEAIHVSVINPAARK